MTRTIESCTDISHKDCPWCVKAVFGLKGSESAAHPVDWPVSSLWAQPGLSWREAWRISIGARSQEAQVALEANVFRSELQRTEQWGIAACWSRHYLRKGDSWPQQAFCTPCWRPFNHKAWRERATLLKALTARPCLRQLQLCDPGRVSARGGRWNFPAHWSARHRTQQNGDGPPAGYGRGGTAGGGAWKSKGKQQVAGGCHCNFHNNSNSDLEPCEGRWRAEGWSNNTCEHQGRSGG